MSGPLCDLCGNHPGASRYLCARCAIGVGLLGTHRERAEERREKRRKAERDEKRAERAAS